MLLKEFLLNEKNQNMNFTISSYLQNKLKISMNETKKNSYK